MVYIFQSNYFIPDKRHQLKLEKPYNLQPNVFLNGVVSGFYLFLNRHKIVEKL